MSRQTLLRTFMAAVAMTAFATTLTVPAYADDRRGRGGWDGDRGRGGDRGGWDRGRRDHGRDYDRRDRGRDHDRRYRDSSRLSLGFVFGGPAYHPRAYYAPPAYYGPRRSTTVVIAPRPVYPNAYNLAAYQCIWENRFDYWGGRPADISVQVCADGYGAVYTVQGSQRLIRFH